MMIWHRDSTGDAMTAPQPKSAADALRQVLEIVDMFEEEDRRMAADTVLLNPALDRSRLSGPVDLAYFTEETHTHTAICLAAGLIGDAIREKFGLPKKED
jgi:hypothetical protein